MDSTLPVRGVASSLRSGPGAGLVAALTTIALVGAPQRVAAQGTAAAVATDVVISTCYVPLIGAIYIVGATNTQPKCVATSHIPLSWNQRGPAGVQGPIGPAGPQGALGVQGAKGDKGDPGAAGAVGPSGPQGPKGDTGPTGAAGANGLDGKPGEDGAMGPQGPTGATGAQGAPGSVGPPGPAGSAAGGIAGLEQVWKMHDNIHFDPNGGGRSYSTPCSAGKKVLSGNVGRNIGVDVMSSAPNPDLSAWNFIANATSATPASLQLVIICATAS